MNSGNNTCCTLYLSWDKPRRILACTVSDDWNSVSQYLEASHRVIVKQTSRNVATRQVLEFPITHMTSHVTLKFLQGTQQSHFISFTPMTQQRPAERNWLRTSRSAALYNLPNPNSRSLNWNCRKDERFHAFRPPWRGKEADARREVQGCRGLSIMR